MEPVARPLLRPEDGRIRRICVYKQLPKRPQHDTQSNMGPRMHVGTFLGFHKTPNAYRVMAADGSVVKSRGLSRRCVADRWNAETLQAVQATPWSLRAPTPDAATIPMGDPVEPHEPVPDGPLVARRLKITRKMLHEHGTTDACAQCFHIRAFGENKPGLAHSERCRNRLMEALGHTAAGAARLERYAERVDRATTGHHESFRGPTQEHPGASGVRGAMAVPSDDLGPTETPMATATSATSHDTAMGAGDGDMADDDEENVVTAMMSIGELKKRIQESQQHVQQPEDREASDVVQVLAMLGGGPQELPERA